MSSTGRVDEGFVTQEESTLDDGNYSLDASFSFDADTDVRAETMAVMSRAQFWWRMEVEHVKSELLHVVAGSRKK